MMRHKTIAILGALALVLSACGSDGSTEASDGGADREAVLEWMMDQGETQESAECFAEQLSDYTAADFDAFDAAESEDDVPQGMAEDVLAAAGQCVDL